MYIHSEIQRRDIYRPSPLSPIYTSHLSIPQSSTLSPIYTSHLSIPQSSTLSPYADYCANLVTAKQTLEAKRQDPPLEDFLQVTHIMSYFTHVRM